jgi:hypothetical protein
MTGMNILFYYFKSNNEVDEKLQEVIDTIFLKEETEIYRSIGRQEDKGFYCRKEEIKRCLN